MSDQAAAFASPSAENPSTSSALRNARDVYGDLNIAIDYAPTNSLRPYARTLRKHSAEHIEQLQASIEAFGFVQPLLIDSNNEIVAGYGLWEAARKLRRPTVPVVRLDHFDEAQKRALRIALNRLGETSEWDKELLALEFQELVDLDLNLELTFDLSITGFDAAEIDQMIEANKSDKADGTDADEALPEEVAGPPVSEVGDLWILGEHRLICGDSRDEQTYAALMNGARAAMGIHDSPYDVRISNHVAKPGRHREFVMGSGELGPEFVPFLRSFLIASKSAMTPGAYAFCFMDWRHMGEMLQAAAETGLELKNLCVWDKGVGGMGSLYRSQHELAFILRDPKGPLRNNVELGRYGRNRTNVWNYPGGASLSREREFHPTLKSVAMIADAIRDVSNRGDIVLDSFCGSGTTIIASAKVGRRGYAVELDPGYVDVAVQRWQSWSGEVARHAASGLTFAEMAEQRREAREAKPNAFDVDAMAADGAPNSAAVAGAPVRIRRRAPRQS